MINFKLLSSVLPTLWNKWVLCNSSRCESGWIANAIKQLFRFCHEFEISLLIVQCIYLLWIIVTRWEKNGRSSRRLNVTFSRATLPKCCYAHAVLCVCLYVCVCGGGSMSDTECTVSDWPSCMLNVGWVRMWVTREWIRDRGSGYVGECVITNEFVSRCLEECLSYWLTSEWMSMT